MSLSERLLTLRSYLDGSGDLEGVSFGMRPATKPAFWWRKHLTAIDEAATTIDTQAAEIERLRASLAEAVGVLRPFGEAADAADDADDLVDDDDLREHFSVIFGGMAVGEMDRDDFRAARDFITTHSGGERE